MPARNHFFDDAMRATRLSEEKYQALLKVLDQAGQGKSVKVKVFLPLIALEKTSFEVIPAEEFRTYVRVHSLDLRPVRQIVARYWERTHGLPQKEKLLPASYRGGVEIEDSGVLRLLNVIEQERKVLQELADDPAATVSNIFEALDKGKEKLGFLNVAVYRPAEDKAGKWIMTGQTFGQNSQRENIPEQGRSIQEITLRSIAERYGKDVFDVDIAETSTFTHEGVKADHQSIQAELSRSHGPTRMLFIKLESRYGVEAIIHLHNRVSPAEQAPEGFLPKDQALADSIKTELQLYFNEVTRTIETIRNRNLIPEPSAPTASQKERRAVEKYLPESRIIRIKRVNAEGRPVRLNLETIKEPGKFLAGQSDEIVTDLFQAFAHAWEPVVGKRLAEDFYSDYIRKAYFEKAEKLAILRDDENRIVGFAAMTREMIEGQSAFCLAGTVLNPKIQGLRLSVKLNQMLVMEAWRQNAHLTGGRVLVVARTANPRVLGSLGPLTELFPDPLKPDKPLLNGRIKILQQLTKRWTPGVAFNAEKAIARSALSKGVGGLLYQRDDVQPYRDQRVNDYCFNNLDYQAGDLFVVSGYFDRRVLVKVFFKTILRSISRLFRNRILGPLLRPSYR